MYSYIIEDYTGKAEFTRERPVVFSLEINPKWLDIGLKPTMAVVALPHGQVFISGGVFTKIVYDHTES